MHSDAVTVKAIINDLQRGIFPALSFQGKFRRKDDMAERIVFRACILDGDIDLIGLAQGFVWELNLAVNDLTDGHLQQFEKHGSPIQ